MSKQHLTTEEREWGEDLYDQLGDMRDAVDEARPRIRAVLDGELPINEYEDWVKNNDKLLSALEL